MAVFSPLSSSLPFSRRHFLQAGVLGVASLALYSGELERHWVDVTRHEIVLRSLPFAFEGLRIAQISDIHMDEYTEPYFLHQVVDKINALKPDVVLMTGDFISERPCPRSFALGAAWQCAEILDELHCRQRYAALGNHDVNVGSFEVTEALAAHGIRVLKNEHLPLERGDARIWLAGVDDPGAGHPDPEKAIPVSIRHRPDEPVLLMCHAPDFADTLSLSSAGRAVDLMLSGHTHGGQICLPILGAMALPAMGKKYVQGWFRFDGMQLYVNRGIGTVGVPFRFDCRPEISVFTLHRS